MTEHKLELPMEEFAIAVGNENKRLHEEIARLEERIERLRAEVEWHEEENQRLRNVMWAVEDMIRDSLREKEL